MIRRLACRLFGHHTIYFLSPMRHPIGLGTACLRCYDIHYRQEDT